ncbi:DUF3027 domain-containing protein [Nocardia sp. CA-290969]|uniref:DUF3027 domain-containing protein n=1 Tax=Nocardia sp. CA-290969 TaxID=3239986 RepID=UPI003D8AB6CA
MSAVSVSDPEVRFILADAVDLARSALLDLEPTGVGAHLGVRAEDECAVTHCFEATLPGYHGWQWAVVVAAAPDTDRVTVSESALLPGPDALIAPEFVPWEQRIRPGDLAPGDLLAPPADDPRLVPGYTATGDPEIDEVAYQVGLGRKQVLSLEGRAEAAQRWYEEFGPDSEMAKAAPASCQTCGFYVPLAGALRAAFGVCANAMGADGHVVHMGYGCGAHSETALPTGAGSPVYEAYDDAAVEVVQVASPKPADESRRSVTTGDEPVGDSSPATAPGAGTPGRTEEVTGESANQVEESRQISTGQAAEAAGSTPGKQPETDGPVVESGAGESADARQSPDTPARVSEEHSRRSDERASRNAEPEVPEAVDTKSGEVRPGSGEAKSAEDLSAPGGAAETERAVHETGDAVPYRHESAGQPFGEPAAGASGETREGSGPESGN